MNLFYVDCKNLVFFILFVIGVSPTSAQTSSPADSPLFDSTALMNTKIVLKGELTQGALILGTTSPQTSIWLGQKVVDITDSGEFVIGFGRDAKLSQKLTWKFKGHPRQSKILTLSKRKYDIQKIMGVPQKMVTPAKSTLSRIKTEVQLVKTARSKKTSLHYFLQPFIKPLEGPVTGVYGSRRVFNGTPKRPHFGVDYAAPIGTLAHAPIDGVVSLVDDDMYYSGGTLIIDHGFGVSSTYIHLSKILVEEGQPVKQGDPIAKVGKRGRATGPHLDWRINWFNVRIDPQLVLKLSNPSVPVLSIP